MEAPKAEEYLTVDRHYIKSLNIENPNSPSVFYDGRLEGIMPNVEIGIEISATRLSDNAFETVITIQVNCSTQDVQNYTMRFAYAAVCVLKPKQDGSGSDDEDFVRYLVMVEVPYLVFAYIKDKVQQLSIALGYRPLLLQPIDFRGVYEKNAFGAKQG